MRRPGDRLRGFAACWCADETMARLIDPLIADLQLEHGHAVRGGRVWKSRAIHAAGCIAFLKVLAACAWTGTVSLSQGWTADDQKALTSAVAFSSVMIAIAVVLLELPFVANTGVLRNPSPRRFVYLAPQAFSLALTVGATLGIVFGLGGRRFSRRVGAGVILLALAGSVVSFVNLAWITPAANQAFRVLVSGQGDIRPGASELSMGELSAEIEKLSHEPAVTQLRYRLALWFQYHFRVALSFSPLIFALFALAILSSGTLRRRTIGMVAYLSFLAYCMLLYGARAWVFSEAVPACIAAWLPNAATFLGTVLLAGITLRRESDRLALS
jgi:hypothetical protein